MLTLSRCWIALVVLGFCGLLVGCTEGYKPPEGVTVTGVVVLDGKPLEVPNRQAGLGNVQVILVPQGELASSGAEPFSDLAKEDGRFTISGPGAGIKPGKYKLVVYQQDKGYGSDMLQGEFSEANSPIDVEVPANRSGGKHDLGTIDLAKYRQK
jgi:hypothetical protein